MQNWEVQEKEKNYKAINLNYGHHIEINGNRSGRIYEQENGLINPSKMDSKNPMGGPPRQVVPSQYYYI